MKILLVLIISTSLYASGTRIGLVDKYPLGNKNMQFLSAGFGRSYEIAHLDSMQINFKNLSTLINTTKTTLSINTSYNAFFAENSLGKSYTNNSSFEGAKLSNVWGPPLNIPDDGLLQRWVRPIQAVWRS